MNDTEKMAQALRGLLETCHCTNGCAPDDMTCATNVANAALSEYEAARAQPAITVTDEMVQRFLGWRLPDTFAPDCYVSFDREGIKKMGNGSHWPSGTNLLNDPEARAMLEHVLAGTAQPASVAAEWQSIETAPKEGEVLLGTWVSTWDQQPAIHIETICFSFGAWIYAYDGDLCPQSPTHWTPLPPPPSEPQP